MILLIFILLIISTIVLLIMGFDDCEDKLITFGFITLIITVLFGIYGACHGFLYYPQSDGIHQGVITAVDKEGIVFHRYKVYLKSSAFTTQGDETEYCVYVDEIELISQLKENIGKQVKLYYGHPGGYIGIQSCGTYHITKVEPIEE